MAAGGRSFYRVVVERNLVCEIRAIDAREADCTEDDPLRVSVQLAQNNQTKGCLDGTYDFASFDAARHFATLCAGYLKSFCEKSVEALDRMDGLDGESWLNPYVPKPPIDEQQD